MPDLRHGRGDGNVHNVAGKGTALPGEMHRLLVYDRLGQLERGRGKKQMEWQGWTLKHTRRDYELHRNLCL